MPLEPYFSRLMRHHYVWAYLGKGMWFDQWVFRNPAKLMKAVAGVYSDHEVEVDVQKVEVHLDVQNFTSDQIKVKVIGNKVMVEANKKIKKEDGWTTSHFHEQFGLPEGFPPERVECHLDKGKLVLVAFKSEPLQERAVPIQEKPSDTGSEEKK